MSLDAAIVDYSAGLLLRYFRAGTALDADVPRLDRLRDVEILKGHWALSAPVRALVDYLLARPHETQALLGFRVRVDDAVARGRIDALRTWRYRLQTGLPSAVVAHEPVRSFDTGPNLLLAWVLREAASLTGRLLSWQGPASPYLPTLEAAQQQMRKVQRLEALREPLRAVSLGRRPSAGAVRDSARSRRQLYRLAVDAYSLLQGIERGNEASMEKVARTALLGPLEDWRRFELAVGLAVGEALAEVAGEPLHLNLLASSSKDPIATAGRFAVHWQQITKYHQQPPLEPSEIAARTALDAYGKSIGTERPDLVIVDRDKDAVVAIVEVKYLAGDTADARFRDAVLQIVRYARAYVPPGATAGLISKSLVAISQEAPTLLDETAPAPRSIDFDGISRQQLLPWAAALAA
jgi:hypothetical protein